MGCEKTGSMIRVVLLILGVGLINLQCSGQPNSSTDVKFLFDQLSIKQIPKIEKALRSKQLQVESQTFLSADYFPGADNPLISPYPLIFIRKDKSFEPTPDVEVSYFFTENDSLTRLISYNWSPNKTGTDLANIQSHADMLTEYTNKYDQVFDQLTNTLGEPTDHDLNIKKVEKKDYGQWLEKSAKWKKGNVTTELKMVFTQNKDKVGTQRIRVKIFWNN